MTKAASVAQLVSKPASHIHTVYIYIYTHRYCCRVFNLQYDKSITSSFSGKHHGLHISNNAGCSSANEKNTF